jgi:hypothetical protein
MTFPFQRSMSKHQSIYRCGVIEVVQQSNCQDNVELHQIVEVCSLKLLALELSPHAESCLGLIDIG